MSDFCLHKKTDKKKNGFTIIEVVLVLAVAGLIFLMVFVAFPNLQKNQRDTQRKYQVSLLSTSLINYQTNGGKFSSLNTTGSHTLTYKPELGTYNWYDNNASVNTGAHESFVRGYLMTGELYIDPDGNPITIVFQGYNSAGVVRSQYGGNNSEDTKKWLGKKDGLGNHRFNVIFNAKCNKNFVEDESLISEYNPGNHFAISYWLESGIYCQDY